MAAAVGVALVVGTAMLAINPDQGYRIVAAAVIGLPRLLPSPVDQEIASARSADGTRIAFATLGTGPPVVQVRVWLTHLETTAILNAEWLKRIGARHRYIHYDGRGFGLSERGVQHSRGARLADLEAVIEAAGVDHFTLFGISAGVPVAVDYAVRHPERVTRLVLYGAQGVPVASELDPETAEATIALVKHWGSGNEAVHAYVRSMFVPDASDFELHVFDELMSLSGTGVDAGAFLESAKGVDIRELAKQVRVQTLILHRRQDPLIPFEAGLELSSLIPGARLMPLAGKGHLLLPRDLERMVAEFEAFLEEDPTKP